MKKNLTTKKVIVDNNTYKKIDIPAYTVELLATVNENLNKINIHLDSTISQINVNKK